ncbi:MAG: hypothetical protein J7M13_03735 [Synergistetes bacterium]|nr:hypothetical protein [Synergistota bacterium]
MHGYGGKILFIDLSRRKLQEEPTSSYLGTLGGRGLGQRLLFDLSSPSIDPLDEESVIILSAGALSGTSMPAVSRLSVDFKNALNCGVGSANVGGSFSSMMKYAGYDAIVITGKAGSPIYIYVDENGAYIRDASSIWGMDTWNADLTIRRLESNDSLSTALIGPAGENLVKFSCLIVDRGRAAGYGGAGAVFGSKNLKGIAVSGSKPISVYDPSILRSVVKRLYTAFRNSEVARIHSEGGTFKAYLLPGEKRPHGVRNMSDEFYPNEKLSRIKRERFDKEFLVKRLSCFSCPVRCSALYRIDGKYCEGIQANMVRAFGTNLDILDPPTILRANLMVNSYGLDCDQTSSIIAWAIECFEHGIIDVGDTGGLELRWGRGDAILKLIDMITHKEGFGAVLADGLYEAVKKIGRGSERYAMLVKKVGLMEAGMRSHKGWALGIITSTKGCGHTRGAPALEFRRISPDISRKVLGIGDISDPTSYDNKPELVVWQERYKAIIDSMGICSLMSMWQDVNLYRLEDISEAYRALTGISFSPDELMDFGESLQTLERKFNGIHAHFDRKDDYPPLKLVDIPVSEGVYKGERLNLVEWDKMLNRYYELHRWNCEDGLPS